MAEPNTDQTEVVKTEIIKRYLRVVAAWQTNKQEIERLQAQIAEIEKKQVDLFKEGDDCTVAARLFGFDLEAEIRALVQETGSSSETAPPAQMPLPISAETSPPKVKDLVLAAAREAYPKPVRAAQVRQTLEARGIKVHEKTVGMTLYRWLRAGELRRDGWDWFFVPEEQRGDENADADTSAQVSLLEQ